MTLYLFLKYVASCRVQVFGRNPSGEKLYTLLYAGKSSNLLTCSDSFLQCALLWCEPYNEKRYPVLRIFVDYERC